MMASPFRVIALLVATSVSFSSTAGFAQNRCQAGGPGCVLPLRAPTVAELPPPPPVVSAPVEAPVAVAAARSGFSPFLLIALAAVAALAAYFLLGDDNDDEAPASP